MKFILTAIYIYIYIFYLQHSFIQVFADNMDFKFRIILHCMFFIYRRYIFCMHVFIVQRIDLDFRNLCYIEIYIIIIINCV